MDMITKLPISGVYDLILVVTDLLSKLIHFILFKEALLSSFLANTFCTHIFFLHGVPDKIVSD